MTEEKNKTRFALTGAIVAAVTASLCCILPLIAAVIGFTGFAASQFFERWRPYLLAVTFGLLAVGFYLAYRRPREACEVGSVCERTPIGRWNRAALWLVAVLVVVLAAFPYYSGWVARAVTKAKGPAEVPAQSSQAHAVLKIDGMVCGSCAALLEKKLSQMPGVRRAEVSFEKKQAILDYDPRSVDPSRFAKSVTDAGYKVAGSPTASD
jgi:copper chaperone CopZ